MPNMGNTRAWPLLRTTNLGEALSLAERLLSITSWHDPAACHLSAWAHNEADLRQLVEAFPDAATACYSYTDALPVEVTQPLATFEKANAAARAGADITSCYVSWHDLKWPPVADLGLSEEYKYAEIEVACNSHDIWCEVPSAEHTVFVHSRAGDDDRAAWLAERAGTRVAGAAELGW